jgi:hypothetical protein
MRTKLLLTLFLALWTFSAAAESLQQLVEQVVKKNAALARTQKKVEKVSEETGDLVTKYRMVTDQLDSLEAYLRQVEKLVEAQRKEMAHLQEQIDNAAMVGREMFPLIQGMIDALEAFINLDVPFLSEERHKRVQELRELMTRADVADSEKYRRLLEAFQIEVNYGHTIEDYDGTIEIEGKTVSVSFLRVGRVALLYITPDEKHLGFWNQAQRKWEPLSPDYRDAIKKGLRMARKQTTYDLLRIPVPAPSEAEVKQ